MSNQNGRIYIDTSTTPPKGIDVLNDLGYVLGTGSGDVGVNCTNNGINPASKFKPFCHSAVGFASDAAHLTALRSRNCGLTMKKYGTLANLVSAGVAYAVSPATGSLAWIYDRPRGRVNSEWFRVFDFKEYLHYAGWGWQYGVYPNPCYELDVPSFQEGVSSVTDIALADLAGDGSNGQTTDYKYYDLHALNFGVAYRKVGQTSGAKGITFTEATSSQVPIPSELTSGNAQEYDFIFFFTNQTVNTWTAEGSFPSGDFYLGPMPHSKWKWLASFGVSFVGTAWSGNLHAAMKIKAQAQGANRSYYKIQLVSIYNGQATITDVTTTAGTVYTSSVSTFNVSGSWTGQETFYVRWWYDSQHYKDCLIVPEDSPIV